MRTIRTTGARGSARPGRLWRLGLLAVALLGAQAQQPPAGSRDLFISPGKSTVLDSPVDVMRISVANGDVAEAVAVSPREVVVNGKTPGQTSLIVWQAGGNRLFFDVQVRSPRVDAVQQELREVLPNQEISLRYEEGLVFLEGTVKDQVSAERAVSIASTLGKVVNLLYVNVPPEDAQILLKVYFADVDRSATLNLGLNFFGTGKGNTAGSVTTGAFPQPLVTPQVGSTPSSLTLSQALNIFLFRTDLNLGATIEALQARSLAQILAEPNLLAINGKAASFLEGGEFPFPTLQGGGAGLGQVTIQFREFGVRLTFVPVITPRGTIRLQVTPEVSALDFANGLVINGFTIPALDTRRVQTEIELEDGQSFVIGGLLNNQTTETLSKIPGLANIPFFGKLFQSKASTKSNTELLVMVTPQVVRPIPKDQKLPDLKFPAPFLPSNTAATPPQTPGPGVTGPVQVHPPQLTIPFEQLLESEKPVSTGQTAPQGATYPIQFVPMPVVPTQPQGNPNPPGTGTAPGATPGGTAAPQPNQGAVAEPAGGTTPLAAANPAGPVSGDPGGGR
jgi:pilus assembly protein CpaC